MLCRAGSMIEDGRTWMAILAVAGALLREKTLDGAAVEAIMRETRL